MSPVSNKIVICKMFLQTIDQVGRVFGNDSGDGSSKPGWFIHKTKKKNGTRCHLG